MPISGSCFYMFFMNLPSKFVGEAWSKYLLWTPNKPVLRLFCLFPSMCMQHCFHHLLSAIKCASSRRPPNCKGQGSQKAGQDEHQQLWTILQNHINVHNCFNCLFGGGLGSNFRWFLPQLFKSPALQQQDSSRVYYCFDGEPRWVVVVIILRLCGWFWNQNAFGLTEYSRGMADAVF